MVSIMNFAKSREGLFETRHKIKVKNYRQNYQTLTKKVGAEGLEPTTEQNKSYLFRQTFSILCLESTPGKPIPGIVIIDVMKDELYIEKTTFNLSAIRIENYPPCIN